MVIKWTLRGFGTDVFKVKAGNPSFKGLLPGLSEYDDFYKGAAIDAQIVIGTPGTLKSWMRPGRFQQLNVSGIKILVFDEADQMMAATGFADDSTRMFKEIQKVTARRGGQVQALGGVPGAVGHGRAARGVAEQQHVHIAAICLGDPLGFAR